jgi:hypothetical protein
MSCDCNTLVVGEAGVQGPQGLAGINGTNGTNGINAFTTLTVNFVQPAAAYPTIPYTATLTVANNAWIALSQIIYIQAAGYYQVTSLSGSTQVVVNLLITDGIAFGGTVPSGRKVTPSGNILALASYNSISVAGPTALDGAVRINQSLDDVDTHISGTTDNDLLFVDASADSVGIGTNTPSVKLHVQGDIRATGNADLDGSVTVNDSGSNSSVFRVEGQGAPNLLCTSPANNRVGINTNSPISLFHVAGLSELQSLNVNTAASSGNVFSVLGVSSETRLYVTDSAVGVGTSSPSAVGVPASGTNLTVNGIINSKGLVVTPSGSVTDGITGIYCGQVTFGATFTVAASAVTSQAITVPGAVVGNYVLVGTPVPSTSVFYTEVITTGYVTATNTVTVYFRNLSATSYTFAAGTTLRAVVLNTSAIV